MITSLTERNFDTGECVLNVACGPANGDPLILLHGATNWWRGWEPILPAIAANAQVFVIDLRGNGRSGRTPGAYGVVDMARDVASFISTNFERKTDLIGHSFGGHVALALTSMLPERIQRLVLEDVPLALNENRLVGRPAGPGFVDWLRILKSRPDRRRIQAYVRRLAPDDSNTQHEIRAECLSLLDPDVLETYVNGKPFADYDPETLFAQLTCPTLLIQADRAVDTRLDEGAAERAASLAPGLRRLAIRGAGHNVHADMPDAFARAVADFYLSPG